MLVSNLAFFIYLNNNVCKHKKIGVTHGQASVQKAVKDFFATAMCLWNGITLRCCHPRAWIGIQGWYSKFYTSEVARV
jgi:hypothetical protein